MDISTNNILTKFLYIAAINILIKANSLAREFIGGVSTSIPQNVNNLFSKFYKK